MIEKIKAEMKTYLDEIGNEDYDLLYLFMEKYLKWAEETERKLLDIFNGVELWENGLGDKKEGYYPAEDYIKESFHSEESGK